MLRLLLTLLITLTGCTNEADFKNGYEERSVVLNDGWQFREGDSPVAANGSAAWMTGDDDQFWRSFNFPDWANVSKNSDNLIWQRVRLPEVKTGDVLFLRGVWMLFEAHVDDKKIYSYGKMDNEGRGYFPGQTWHMINLKPEYSGKYIGFRVFSSDRYVGVYEGAHLGQRSAHMAWMFKRDLPFFLMGAIYIFLGLMMIVIFARDRTDMTNISFALFAISVGLYVLSRTRLKDMLYFDPFFWGNFELTSLFVCPLFFCMFSEKLVGAGPFKILRRVWQVNLLILLVVYLRMIVKQDSMWFFLNPFQIFFLVSCAIVIGVVGQAAWKGHTEARIYLGGVLFVVLASAHDILASLGIINSNSVINHLGVFLLILSLTAIVARRYLRTISIKKNVELASAVQNLLLPKQREGVFAGLNYSSYYRPHGKMSGDWMNFWSVNDEEQRLIFGDVVGKGPRAALAVAAISAFIENSREADESMEQCIQRINSGLCKLFSFHITSTLSAASIRSDGTIRLYNCGGVGWMQVSRESGSILLPSSMLGLDLHPKVGIRDVHLAEGEALCAFSDGVLEGSRAIKKLRKDLAVLQTGNYDCDKLIQTILDNARKSQAQDDMSMLVIVRPAKSDLEKKVS